MRATPPRPIAEPEIAVLRATLERVPFEPIPPSTVDAVPALTVVATCDCGCANIDFVVGRELASPGRPVAGGYGVTSSGATVEILVFGTPAAIFALRILPLGHEDGTLPRLESIGAMIPGHAS
jgi:hypothetical protein